VNNAIENCVGERRIADDVMPAIDRHLAGHVFLGAADPAANRQGTTSQIR
jgi:hypothetical protein